MQAGYSYQREQFRKNFSLEFMTDFVSQNTDCTADPLNKIGHKCGINAPRVYQKWGDYWTHKAAL